MFATAAISLIPTLVLSARERAKEVIENINQSCADKKLPLAFNVSDAKILQDLDDIHFRCNPDFRFEGFGMDIGLRPKLTFWIWYKKGSQDEVELGKFHIDIR